MIGMEARTERDMLVITEDGYRLELRHDKETGNLFIYIGVEHGRPPEVFIAKFENVADWIHGQQRALE